jgi:hypothetical protein
MSRHKKCEHGKRKSRCKECGGSELCEHNNQKYQCKECGGSQICEHNIQKSGCKKCKGQGICEHNKRKEICKECDGSQICEHNKLRSICKDCDGSQICDHNVNKRYCKKCDGNGICEHDKQKHRCKECNGKSICEHNIEKRNCIKCKGKNICEHNKRKERCITCTPDSKAFCKSCRLFLVKKKTNFLCSYCNPDKPTRQKTKEIRVKTFLEENNYKFIYNKKCNLDNSCQTYYPDFLIDCNTFFLIIECDEDAHNNYDKDCEKIRENNICFALGLPCVFIRFNPDKKKIKMKIKEKVLKSYIDYYIAKEKCDNEVCYLFY